MLLACSTVYYNEHYEMIVDRKEIIQHYMRTWFFVDLFSILPFEVFSSFLAADDVQQVIITDFLKLPRMLRLARFRKRVDNVRVAALTLVLTLVSTLSSTSSSPSPLSPRPRPEPEL